MYKNWIAGVDYPSWMSEAGLKTVTKGYLMPNETVKDAFKRVAKHSASYYKNVKQIGADYEDIIFDYLWKGWLCLATPLFSNFGTTRGLPISCYGIDLDDTLNSIAGGVVEMMKMTQQGGGVGVYGGRIRPAGAPIKNGGESNGSVPYAKIYDDAASATSQNGVRRGAISWNTPFSHGDFWDVLKMRRPEGDLSRQCLGINHCITLTEQDKYNILNGIGDARAKWVAILKTRKETGQPYMMFLDNVNKDNPQSYEDLHLSVNFTNICTEITLATDGNHSFVCCLSSLNLAKYDEWKDQPLAYYALLFLDSVISDFISKVEMRIWGRTFEENEEYPALDFHYGRENIYFYKMLNFAKKSRAVGVGALGWHTFLQSKMIPFGSLLASSYTRKIFGKIHSETRNASKLLAEVYGEPLWCKGLNRRNTHTIAIAPTISNATIANASHSIEPIIGNIYTQDGAKGSFVQKNPHFMGLLRTKYPEHNNFKTELSILENDGSVQHLDFLTDEEKEVFLTAYEINQMDIIRQAALRQQYIDQAQSLNLFFEPDCDTKILHQVHMGAWEMGLKTLYYFRSKPQTRASSVFKSEKSSVKSKPQVDEGCSFCEG